MDPNSKKYYKIGANFASAGAGALVETFQGSVSYLFGFMCISLFKIHHRKTNLINAINQHDPYGLITYDIVCLLGLF